ncbi:MAG: ribonuclease III [Chitinophagales bacterium]|nr:ribonuclease III [Chitinophagales bacterium]
MISFLKRFFSSLQKTKENDFLLRGIYEYLNKYPLASEENYIRALTHSSYTKKLQEKNERLEFLGDAVINFCVAEALYFKMQDKDEGTLTKARSSIVNRKHLNKIGLEIGIAKYLRHKLHTKHIDDAPDMIGNAFEALIGAYFLDYGMDTVKLMMESLLLKDFDAANFHKQILDAKSYLIEWIQSQKKQLAFEHLTAPTEIGSFRVVLKIDGEERATGIGKNKKEAEQNACANAIQLLQLNE